jgi:transposase
MQTRTEVVKGKLERLRGQWLRVSRESGVKYKTIKNLMQGKVKDPRASSIDKLHDYLSRENA